MDSSNNEEGIPGTERRGAAPVSTPGQYVRETPNLSYQHAGVAFHAPGWYNGFILPPVHQFPQPATPNEIPSNRGKCPRMDNGDGICDLHLLELLERYEQELRDDYNALLRRIEALETTWGIARGKGKEAATAVEDAKSKRIPGLEGCKTKSFNDGLLERYQQLRDNHVALERRVEALEAAFLWKE